MDYTTWTVKRSGTQELSQEQTCSLYEICQQTKINEQPEENNMTWQDCLWSLSYR